MGQVQKKEGPQAIGRWRGGMTTKIHSAVDANDFIQMIQDMGAMVVIPQRTVIATNNQSLIITGTKTTTWWSVSSIELNSFAVLPGAMKSLIATSCLCSTWCVPLSGWREC